MNLALGIAERGRLWLVSHAVEIGAEFVAAPFVAFASGVVLTHLTMFFVSGAVTAVVRHGRRGERDHCGDRDCCQQRNACLGTESPSASRCMQSASPYEVSSALSTSLDVPPRDLLG